MYEERWLSGRMHQTESLVMRCPNSPFMGSNPSLHHNIDVIR